MATRAASRELMLDPGTARPVKDSAVVPQSERVAGADRRRGGPGDVQ